MSAKIHCEACGQPLAAPKSYRVIVHVPRRSGKTKPAESVAMTQAQADSMAFELRAVGYEVEVAGGGRRPRSGWILLLAGNPASITYSTRGDAMAALELARTRMPAGAWSLVRCAS